MSTSVSKSFWTFWSVKTVVAISLVTSTASGVSPRIEKVAYDETKNKRYMYEKGRFLEKGGFAQCYELVDTDTKAVYDGKIVPQVCVTLS